MPRNAEQKIKLLILYDLLRKHTDEFCPMTTVEIVDELKRYGITATRQTVYDDIDVLNRYGYEVICEKGKNNRYFVGDRMFERPEIQVLLNAVGAAKFLSEKKKSALTDKVAELLGFSEAAQIKELLPSDCSSQNNERIYYNIDAITTAILEKKKLSFFYFDYDIHGNRVYRKDKKRYVVNPLGMVYSGEYFYLVCFHDKYGNAANYRIDRMDDVITEAESVSKSKAFENFDLNAYKRELFSMYAGEKTEVTLSFPQELSEVITERFGTNSRIISYGADRYLINTTVRVSKTFYAWLTTFEGKIKIHKPEQARLAYKEYLGNVISSI